MFVSIARPPNVYAPAPSKASFFACVRAALWYNKVFTALSIMSVRPTKTKLFSDTSKPGVIVMKEGIHPDYKPTVIS
ncbi:MAG TPA: hypothetical protein VM141_05680, partial [Planctomycetota bacterium]|nr:hypothetical protein [Planctomycetota bacterium]